MSALLLYGHLYRNKDQQYGIWNGSCFYVEENGMACSKDIATFGANWWFTEHVTRPILPAIEVVLAAKYATETQGQLPIRAWYAIEGSKKRVAASNTTTSASLLEVVGMVALTMLSTSIAVAAFRRFVG